MKKLIIILFSIFLLTGCMVRIKTNEDLIEAANIEINAPKELKVDSRITYDLTDLMLLINNNTKDTISNIDIKATYLDKDNKEISSMTNSYTNIESLSSILAFTILPKDDTLKSYIPDKIKIDIDIKEDNTIKTYNKDIETGYSIKNGEITVNAVNTSKKALKELNMVILYYYKDKMVHYNEILVDKVNKNEIVQESREIPEDLIYDDIDIIVNRAS